jgi:hypothetical protein
MATAALLQPDAIGLKLGVAQSGRLRVRGKDGVHSDASLRNISLMNSLPD